MTHCPSCGRYVGPYDACPYCAARLTGRLHIRTIKAVAIALAMVGLPVLWILAARSPVRLVSIGQLGATMNYAYVRIAGTCIDTPTYDAQSGYLGFWIDDGSGELYVSAYREEAEQIVAKGRAPALGDLVEVAGTIRVRDGVPSLVVNAPEQLASTRPEAFPCSVDEIGVDDKYSWVRIRGQVREVREPYPGLQLVTVHDGSGSIPVALSRDAVAMGADLPDIAPGQTVEIVAAVSEYRGSPQLVLASSDDIVPLEESLDIAEVRPIGQISYGDSGKLVAIRGDIVRRNEFSAGVKLALDDGTGEVAVVLWQSLYDALPDGASMGPGARLEVVGEVGQYGGQLEVVPVYHQDVRALGPATVQAATARPQPAPAASATPLASALPTAQLSITAPAGPATASSPTPLRRPTATATAFSIVTPLRTTAPTVALELIPISGLTADRVGEQVTIEGEVLDAASFSAGFKFTVDDGTGQVVLLLWHEVYDGCWDASGINLGARVRATGRVALFEGELQLQPSFGGDVQAIDSAAAWAPPQQIGSLTGDVAGERVMIEGRVIRVEGISSAVKVFLGDDTGEVLVLIWRNILDRIPNNTGLGTPGSRVRVVGTLSLYRSNLEVVPALPVDVIVLSVP